MAALRLLAALGVAHAARQTSFARHNATAASHASVVAPGVEEGAELTLDNNQYILQWSESPASWAFHEKVKGSYKPKWYFVTPVMCRTGGLWYELKMEHRQAMKRCILVTCNNRGHISEMIPQESCAEHTERVLQTSGPYVIRDSDWELYHIPEIKKKLDPIDGNKRIVKGWFIEDAASIRKQLSRKKHKVGKERVYYFSFEESELLKGLHEDAGWDLSQECKEYRTLWREVGLRFTDESSLERCKSDRIAEREKCLNKYQPMIGTATAWAVKRMFSETTDLKRDLPSCYTWCEKSQCVITKAPKDVKRDTASYMAAMNSWKYTCEQDMDVYLTKKVQWCPTIGNVCDKPWTTFQPCADKLSLPYFK